eukprot:363116-Chlamydomonas_euryale.AAC.7
MGSHPKTHRPFPSCKVWWMQGSYLARSAARRRLRTSSGRLSLRCVGRADAPLLAGDTRTSDPATPELQGLQHPRLPSLLSGLFRVWTAAIDLTRARACCEAVTRPHPSAAHMHISAPHPPNRRPYVLCCVPLRAG